MAALIFFGAAWPQRNSAVVRGRILKVRSLENQLPRRSNIFGPFHENSFCHSVRRTDVSCENSSLLQISFESKFHRVVYEGPKVDLSKIGLCLLIFQSHFTTARGDSNIACSKIIADASNLWFDLQSVKFCHNSNFIENILY